MTDEKDKRIMPPPMRMVAEPHLSSYDEPACQKCGGEIEGWTCQGCGQTFRENDTGALVFAASPPPGELSVDAATGAKAVIRDGKIVISIDVDAPPQEPVMSDLKERLETARIARGAHNRQYDSALAYIADLEAKLAVAREAITDAIDAYGKWKCKTCKQERADAALLSALNTIGEDHG